MLKVFLKPLLLSQAVGFVAVGCASTVKVIEHASLQTKVNLAEPVFLNLAVAERTVICKDNKYIRCPEYSPLTWHLKIDSQKGHNPRRGSYKGKLDYPGKHHLLCL